MSLHREGRMTILLVFLVLVLAGVTGYLINTALILKILIPAPFFILFLLILWFFRIPQRKPVKDENKIVAPADGKIVVIEKTTEMEYFRDERIQISIFMSPLNVHQNVYPLSGSIRYTQYHKGQYLVAWHPKSSTLNERATVVVQHKNGTEILIRQIAGAVARRICTYAKPGDTAQQSSEFGFIKFGSRVDVFLPLDAKIACRVDQKAVNKQTILAELADLQ